MFRNWSICPRTFFIGTAAKDILINHGDMIWDQTFAVLEETFPRYEKNCTFNNV
jgi:hypothetical protein